MMTEEEKEAIEWLEKLVKINKRDNLFNTYAEILLNVILKQSKEIEEALCEMQDKIKAKIEPKLKELDKQINEEWKKYGNSKELQDMEDIYNFLQSLLEKE